MFCSPIFHSCCHFRGIFRLWQASSGEVDHPNNLASWRPTFWDHRSPCYGHNLHQWHRHTRGDFIPFWPFFDQSPTILCRSSLPSPPPWLLLLIGPMGTPDSPPLPFSSNGHRWPVCLCLRLHVRIMFASLFSCLCLPIHVCVCIHWSRPIQLLGPANRVLSSPMSSSTWAESTWSGSAQLAR